MVCHLKPLIHSMDNKYIDIGHGRTAISFVPEDSKDLAIVHLSVIKRLADLLPKANLREIKIIFKEKVEDTQNMIQFVNVLSEELAFHESVNLIKEYNPPDPNA